MKLKEDLKNYNYNLGVLTRENILIDETIRCPS